MDQKQLTADAINSVGECLIRQCQIEGHRRPLETYSQEDLKFFLENMLCDLKLFALKHNLNWQDAEASANNHFNVEKHYI